MVEETATINTVLQELKEFRKENNQRWEQNNKRWEQNEKRWEENNKRWEANEKRWEENDKRWEQNEKRWEANEKRWEENDKRWEQNERRWEENDKKLEAINERVTNIEKNSGPDKEEFLRIFDSMEEAIMKQFTELNEKVDIKFSKADAMFADLGLDIKELQHTSRRHASKINLNDVRIEKLEDWKDELDLNGFVTA